MFTGKMSNLHPPSLDDLGLNLDTNLTSDDILPLADVDAATILNPKSLGVSKQSQIDPNGFGQFGSQYTYKHDKYIYKLYIYTLRNFSRFCIFHLSVYKQNDLL